MQIIIRFYKTLILNFLFIFSGYSQTIDQLHQQLNSAKAEGDINAEIKTNLAISKYYEKQKNYDEAIVFYKINLSIFEKNSQKENMAISYASIANAFLKKSKYNDAIEWNNKGIKQFELLNDQKNLAYSLMLNGDSYLKLKQIEKAIFFFEKSSKAYKSINDGKSEVIVLNKIGAAYSSFGNYDRALLYLNDALKIASSLNGMTQELNQINLNIDVVKKNQKNTDSVKTDFIKQKEGQTQQQITYLSTQNIKSIEEIEKLSIEAQVKELKIKAQQEQLLLKQLQVDKQKKEYEYLQKEKEFERIKQEERIYRQQLIIFSISILSFLLFIVILIVYRYYKEKKKANNILADKNKEILEQGEQIKNQAVEIARHQSQMNPHFIFNAINGFQNEILEGNKESILSQIQSFSMLLRQTLNNAQNEYISLEDEISYLNKYIEFELYRFSKKFDFEVNVEPDILFSCKIPTMLIQPILENTIKHAGLNKRENGKIRLLISKNKEHQTSIFSIEVSDNGIGIQNKKNISIKSHESKGTSITKHRIKLALDKFGIVINDYFTIISPVEENELYKGTTTKIQVPFLLENK